MTLRRLNPEGRRGVIDRNDDSVVPRIRAAALGQQGLLLDALVEALPSLGIDVWSTGQGPPSLIVDQLERRRTDVVLLNLGPTACTKSELSLIRAVADRGPRVIALAGGKGGACIEAGALWALDAAAARLGEVAWAIRMAAAEDTSSQRAWSVILDQARRSMQERLRRQRARFDQLSVREADVLELVCHGRSARQIARISHLSVSTARSHIRHILLKLGVASELAAAAMAFDSGWYQERVFVPPESSDLTMQRDAHRVQHSVDQDRRELETTASFRGGFEGGEGRQV